jgi:DNA repair protein RadC
VISQTERLRLGGLWEGIRAAVLEASPAAARRIEDLRTTPWQGITAGDRQALLLGVALGIEASVPAQRRQLRALAADLLHQAGHVGEGPPPPAPTRATELPPNRRAELASHCIAIAEPELMAALAGVPNAPSAVRALRRALRGLSAAAAMRFLEAIGYPIVVPDKARVRWLARVGFRPGAAGPDAAIARFQELADELAVSAAELNAVLAVFTGAQRDGGDGALCTAKPRCAQCPIREQCPTHLAAREIAPREDVPRGLLATLRPEDRPREKLAERGAHALTDAELLAILLRTGSGRENAVALGNRILREMGSLDRVHQASLAELGALHGVGQVKAITIKAALELARRLEREDPRQSGPVTSSQSVFEYLRRRFLGMKVEHFVVLLLDTRNHVTRVVPVSEGTLNQSLVHPREAFREAVRDSAAAVIFAHNHPSGDPSPSRDDNNVTERLVRAGDLMGVKVLDHVIIGRDSYFSYADRGMLRP